MTSQRRTAVSRSDQVVDPTENVIALVEANAKAASDLREADNKFAGSQHAHLKEVASLRARHAAELRASDLNAQEKTRQVDVLASAASAATLATAVQALAATADRNAENIRNQMNATAAAIAKQTADAQTATQAQTDNLMRGINERLTSLERSSNLGAGRQSVADPQIENLIVEMRKLTAGADTSSGKSAGISASWAVLIGAIALVGSLIGIGLSLSRPSQAPIYLTPPTVQK